MTRDEAIAVGMASYWDCEHESEAEARVAFLSSLAASGFTVVPVEATEKMADTAARNHAKKYGVPLDDITLGEMRKAQEDCKLLWSAMLAAAQEDGK